eukprot:1183141-Prorocentrum_minimum.AAC.4
MPSTQTFLKDCSGISRHNVNGIKKNVETLSHFTREDFSVKWSDQALSFFSAQIDHVRPLIVHGCGLLFVRHMPCFPAGVVLVADKQGQGKGVKRFDRSVRLNPVRHAWSSEAKSRA